MKKYWFLILLFISVAHLNAQAPSYLESFAVEYRDTEGFYLDLGSLSRLLVFDEDSDKSSLESLQALHDDVLWPNANNSFLKGIYIVGERGAELKGSDGKMKERFKLVGWYIKSPFLRLIPEGVKDEDGPDYIVIPSKLSLQHFDLKDLSNKQKKTISDLKINWNEALQISWIGQAPTWFSFVNKKSTGKLKP